MDRRLIGFERGVALNQGAEINLQSLAGLNFHIISVPRRSHELLNTGSSGLDGPHCLDRRSALGQSSGLKVEQIQLADLSAALLLRH